MTIVQMSRGLRFFVTVLMAALLLTVLIFFLSPDLARNTLVNALPNVEILTEPTVSTVYLLLTLGCVLVSVQMFVLWHIRALCGFFAQGKVLTDSSARHIVRIGLGLIVFPFATTLYGMVSSFLLTLNNPPGQGALVVSFSSADVGYWVGGVLLAMVGTAMYEAVRVANENREFI